MPCSASATNHSSARPTITASLQLVADNAAYSSVGFDFRRAVQSRLQVEAPPSAAIIDMRRRPQANTTSRRRPPPATSAEPGAGPLEETSSDVAAPTERPTAAVTPTSEAPAAGADAASANDPENVAALSRPAATAETMIDGAREAAPAPETTAAASDQENKSLHAFPWPMPDLRSVAAAVAVNEPHDVQPPPRERINLTGPPTDAAGPSRRARAQNRIEKAKARFASLCGYDACNAWPRIQYAPTQFSQTQYTPTTEQNFGSHAGRIFNRRHHKPILRRQAGCAGPLYETAYQKAQSAEPRSRTRRPAGRSSAPPTGKPGGGIDRGAAHSHSLCVTRNLLLGARVIPLSVLDLSPVTTVTPGSGALRNSLDLARLADRLGYTALLARRAPQSGEHRQLSARHHDRADRGGNDTPSRRLRRRDAGEPCAADGRRTI